MEDITLTNETIEQYHQRLNGQLREENNELRNSLEMYSGVLEQTEKEITRLEIVNIQLNNRIKEATEYIKLKFVKQGGFTSYEWNDLLNELLEMLEGEK